MYWLLNIFFVVIICWLIRKNTKHTHELIRGLLDDISEIKTKLGIEIFHPRSPRQGTMEESEIFELQLQVESQKENIDETKDKIDKLLAMAGLQNFVLNKILSGIDVTDKSICGRGENNIYEIVRYLCRENKIKSGTSIKDFISEINNVIEQTENREKLKSDLYWTMSALEDYKNKDDKNQNFIFCWWGSFPPSAVELIIKDDSVMEINEFDEASGVLFDMGYYHQDCLNRLVDREILYKRKIL